MNIDKIKQIQAILGVPEDGIWGPVSQGMLTAIISRIDQSNGVHSVIASSFADPADIAAFRACKAKGGSDQFCFSKGDNGIGKWGRDCSEGSGPAVALPPEDWQKFEDPQRLKVLLTFHDKQVVCDLGDTMPHKANIKNGASIDVNPDAAHILGLTPPFLVPVTWQWA